MKTTCSAEPEKILHIDIETYSSVDLVKSGVYKYAESEDFQVLLFAYSYDDAPVTVLDLTRQKLPDKIIKDLKDPHVLKKAHNAQFERICLSQYVYKQELQRWIDCGFWDSTPPKFSHLDPEGWYCTMVHSSMCGLPASLKQVGEALGLAEDKQKLTTGKALIRYFCMPCKPTRSNGGRTRNLPKDDPERWAQFIEYNAQDVVTEMAIEEKLLTIYKMPDIELRRYWLDQKVSDVGVGVDMDLVQKVLAYGKAHQQEVLDEGQRLAGVPISSVAQLKRWIKEKTGQEVKSLTKATLDELIESQTDKTVKRVLKLRKESGKISVKKYDVFDRAVCEDGRMHGILQFYGARTGRWAGRLIQPQNLPRNSFDDFDTARELVKDEEWDMLGMLYPSANDVFSTLIRTAFVPSFGKAFAVADYSAIEARVIAWLADERWRMNAFHNGKDIYCQSASMMFNVPVEKHGRNSHLRKKGKVAELACGYGGNIGALKAFGADKMGLSDTDMADIIAKWRAASPNICLLWKTFDRMVSRAVKLPGTPIHGPKGITFTVRDGLMEVKLPSGRCLIYQNPRFETETGFGTRFTFDGLNQTTRKWEPISTWGGKLTENLVQAIARDCLAIAIDRMAERGYLPVMHIHDEVVVEVPDYNREEHLKRIEDIMAMPIRWAEGLELTAAGFTSDYYMKD